MNEPIEVINRGPFHIEIYPDSHVENPRRDYEHQGKFWTWHRRYESPDPVPSWAYPGEDLDAEIRSHIADVRMILPVYAYEHGGIVYRAAKAFSDP